MTTTGRPSSYTQEIADDICERIADGESLRSICSGEDMPNKATVCRWLAKHSSFSDQYAHARESQGDALFDDCLALADGKSTDELKAAADIQERKLQIETRKWMAGKLKGKYSDKVKHVGGDDGDNPIAFTGFKRQFID